MGQDPNQPYSGQYGQQPGQYGQPGVPPQGNYQGGYQQQGAYPPPQNPGYPPPNTGYQQPNTGYQQPGPGYQYQQPYGQPGAGAQYNTGHPNGPSSMSMDPNTAAGLSYLVGWVTGLIFFLIEKQNRFVRFHAMQAILLSASTIIAYIVLSIISGILSFISILGCIFGLFIVVLWLGYAVIWIICMVNAFQGKYFKLPVIGDMAENWSGGGTTPPSYR
jgi:uncharacterized membrane protein